MTAQAAVSVVEPAFFAAVTPWPLLRIRVPRREPEAPPVGKCFRRRKLISGDSAPAIPSLTESGRKSARRLRVWLVTGGSHGIGHRTRGVFGVFVGLFEHAFFVIAGFILMVLGLVSA